MWCLYSPSSEGEEENQDTDSVGVTAGADCGAQETNAGAPEKLNKKPTVWCH
jgi:hypothetical protein